MALLPYYRERISRSVPPWLRRGTAEKILYAFGVHVDAFADALNASLRLRFPGLYSFESLGLLGRERRIARGPSEVDAAYATRLRRWLTDHRARGGPYALLAQLHAYYAPGEVIADLVYYSGRSFHLAADGAVTRSDLAWTPDTNAAKWARWWLFIYSDAYMSLDDAAAAALRVVPRGWNAAHANGSLTVLSSEAELWNWPQGHTWNESGYWNTAPAFVLSIED